LAATPVTANGGFYTEVLGGKVVLGPVPTNVELANSFIVINAGGGPTDDKPTITLDRYETGCYLRDPQRDCGLRAGRLWLPWWLSLIFSAYEDRGPAGYGAME
jgi:hypothetical protein